MGWCRERMPESRFPATAATRLAASWSASVSIPWCFLRECVSVYAVQLFRCFYCSTALCAIYFLSPFSRLSFSPCFCLCQGIAFPRAASFFGIIKMVPVCVLPVWIGIGPLLLFFSPALCSVLERFAVVSFVYGVTIRKKHLHFRRLVGSRCEIICLLVQLPRTGVPMLPLPTNKEGFLFLMLVDTLFSCCFCTFFSSLLGVLCTRCKLNVYLFG